MHKIRCAALRKHKKKERVHVHDLINESGLHIRPKRRRSKSRTKPQEATVQVQYLYLFPPVLFQKVQTISGVFEASSSESTRDEKRCPHFATNHDLQSASGSIVRPMRCALVNALVHGDSEHRRVNSFFSVRFCDGDIKLRYVHCVNCATLFGIGQSGVECP